METASMPEGVMQKCRILTFNNVFIVQTLAKTEKVIASVCLKNAQTSIKNKQIDSRFIIEKSL